jgi:hypothetical protein
MDRNKVDHVDREQVLVIQVNRAGEVTLETYWVGVGDEVYI